jgi:citrate lyase beta subunit
MGHIAFCKVCSSHAAHSASLDISDAPTFNVNDPAALRRDSEKARLMGFTNAGLQPCKRVVDKVV